MSEVLLTKITIIHVTGMVENHGLLSNVSSQLGLNSSHKHNAVICILPIV